jgi:hypothetical protein
MSTDRYADSQQHRFDTAIYLHYVEVELDQVFKPVSKEEFKRIVYPAANWCRMFYSNPNNLYRLSDSKEVWYDQYGNHLGHVWRELSKESDTGTIENYWINKTIFK